MAASDHILTNVALQEVRAADLLKVSFAQKQDFLPAARAPHPSVVPIVPAGVKGTLLDC